MDTSIVIVVDGDTIFGVGDIKVEGTVTNVLEFCHAFASCNDFSFARAE